MKLLITSTAQLAQFVTFSGDLEYDRLIPALRSAQGFLASYVGRGLLDQVAQAQEAVDAKFAELEPYVLAPLGNLALLKVINAGNVRITGLGVMRTKTPDSSDVFEWQLERVVVALRQEAFSGLEDLLRYLEDHKTEFPAYTQSQEYNLVKNQLIRSADLFSHYYTIGGSRLVFETLNPAMCTAEIRTIRPMLGDQFTALLGAALTAPQVVLLDAARRALVYLTIARALREKLVSISDTGVQVCGISSFGTINYKQPANDKQLAISLTYFDKEAATFVTELATLLTPAPTGEPAPDRGSPVINKAIVAL